MKIVITGGADGLGKAIVKQLLEHKHEVIIIDKEIGNIKGISKEFNIANLYQCDITKSDQIIETVEKILNKDKKIDVLINNAGIWLDESSENDLEQYKNMILVNLFGSIAVTKSFLPTFLKQKYGHIVNINSQAGVVPSTNSPVYSATKHGMVGFRKSIRQELSNNGIKMTDIHPGMIKTELFAKAGVNFTKALFDKFALTKDIVAQAVVWAIEQPKDIVIPALEIKNINESY